MTPTSVGMRCPECSAESTRVVRGPQIAASGDPVVTYTLIGICALAFVATGFGAGGNALFQDGALQGFTMVNGFQEYSGGVNGGELWRLVTSGFLHASMIHILFNMYLLFILGQMFERRWGSGRFGAIFFTALLCGSVGALAQTTLGPTVGASGAVFGLMGAALVQLYADGEDPWRSNIGILVLINLALGFIIEGVSVGGHIGGLIGGALTMAAIHFADGRRLPRWSAYVICLAISLVAIVAAVAVAGDPHNYDLSLG